MSGRGGTGRTVVLEPDGERGVVRVTFDRPEVLNAVDDEVLDDLEAVVGRLEADWGTAVAILTGRGARAFIAGGDIAHMAGLDPSAGERWVHRGQRLLRRLERLPQVTIVAVNGFALGGGLEVALACDLRVAADTARLGVPEVTVGLIPGWGGTQRLTRLVGRGAAKDLVFTGRVVDAAEALRLGWSPGSADDDGIGRRNVGRGASDRIGHPGRDGQRRELRRNAPRKRRDSGP